MDQDPHAQQLTRYRKKGLLVDTNVLLLFFVGNCDRSRIGKFKRTTMFTETDYDLLLNVFRFFARVVTTPHILTEVSNLIGQLPEELKPQHYLGFASASRFLEEKYTPSADLAKFDHFTTFGLTDSGIIEDAKGKYLVLTDDLRLYGYLLRVGIDAINFNHLRTETWAS